MSEAGFSTRLRGMIAWSATGQAFYVLSQFGILVLLTRFASIEDVGRFGLAGAIATPVFFFFTLGLRFNQATDMSDRFGFRDFLLLRSVTTICGLVTIAGIVMFMETDDRTVYFVALVSVARAVGMLSDLMYGVFQKNDRIDLMAGSQIARSILSIAVFALILVVDGSVMLALSSYFLSLLAVFLAFDAPWGVRLTKMDRRRATLSETWKLAVDSAPLGASLLFTSLGAMLPRLLLARFVGLESLGYFTAVGYINQAMKMLFQALDQALIGRLARLWHEGRTKLFHGLLLKIGASLFGAVLFAALMSQPYNGLILKLVFGEDFEAYGDLMFFVLIAVAFGAPCQVYQNALIAQREFRAQLLNRIIQTLLIAVFCTAGTVFLGLNGAAIGMAAASVVQIPVLYWIIRGRSAPRAFRSGHDNA